MSVSIKVGGKLNFSWSTCCASLINFWHFLMKTSDYQAVSLSASVQSSLCLLSPTVFSLYLDWEHFFSVSTSEQWFAFVTLSWIIIILKVQGKKYKWCFLSASPIQTLYIMTFSNEEKKKIVNYKTIGLFTRCGNPFDLSTTKFQFWISIIIEDTWEATLLPY